MNKTLTIYSGILALCLNFILGTVSGQHPPVKDVTVAEAAELIRNNRQLQILDVRTPPEVKRGALKRSYKINWFDPDFLQQAFRLDRRRPVLVYCKVGGRSAAAAKKLREAGFVMVYNLTGGYQQWAKERLE